MNNPNDFKICCVCNKIKPITDFGILKSLKDGRRPQCKQCRKNQYYVNWEKSKEEKRKSYEIHKEKRLETMKKNYEENPQIYKKRASDYYYNNQDKIKKYRKWLNESGQKQRKRKEYFERNPSAKIAERFRSRLASMISKQKGTKSASSLELLGCSYEELKKHLETQFRDGMTWENYGNFWHVDHIRPCCAFDLTNSEQQKECFNFKNLRPLLAIENMQKVQDDLALKKELKG